ncbi:MAG: nucleotidyltransferase family protein [Ginsengibacter sp.]
MIKEAIILAGGFGTRLRSVVSDQPKCMAPVNGKPFLFYVINFLQAGGIEKFIFSVGYMHGQIENYLQKEYSFLDYKIALETEPLGTGGGIKLACEKCKEENVIVCNGDTLFKVDLRKLANFHETKNAACSLSLKPMQNFDRYGVVELNDNDSIKSFKEKKFYNSGLINGGTYALNVARFLKENLPEKFSFEKDYLERNVMDVTGDEQKLCGIIQDDYFIDIGIPEDYERAQVELTPNPNPNPSP